MPAILITPENLKFAKSALADELPTIRSSHLTEALAAAVDHKSNASLRAAIAQPASDWPHFTYFNAQKFNDRLTSFGYPNVDSSIIGTVARSPLMPAKTWIEYPKGDLATNKWLFSDCSKRDVPLVYIEIETEFVKLTWDCITIQSKSLDDVLDGGVGDNLIGIMYRAFEHLRKPDLGKAEFLGSAFTGTIANLTIGSARLLADAYCAVLYWELERVKVRRDPFGEMRRQSG